MNILASYICFEKDIINTHLKGVVWGDFLDLIFCKRKTLLVKKARFTAKMFLYKNKSYSFSHFWVIFEIQEMESLIHSGQKSIKYE